MKLVIDIEPLRKRADELDVLIDKYSKSCGGVFELKALMTEVEVIRNILKGATPLSEVVKEIEEKVAKWDALDKKIEAVYFDENGNERDEEDIDFDLLTIGEVAARAFGYL